MLEQVRLSYPCCELGALRDPIGGWHEIEFVTDRASQVGLGWVGAHVGILGVIVFDELL